MSSSGIKTDIFDDLEADVINVPDTLFVQQVNVLDFINDLSGNLVDLSENLAEDINNLSDLSNNLVYFRSDNPEKIMFYDLSSNKIIIKQIDTNNETLFKNFTNQNYTKIGNDSKLYIYHDLDVTLPLKSAGFWNVHDELSQLQRDAFGLRFDVTNLQAAESLTSAALVDTNAILTATTATADAALLTGTNALALAGTKNNIINWNYPLYYDSSDNAFFKYDITYFELDVSNNLTFNNMFWKKDISNNLYFTSGKVGIGLTNPNYNLDVLGNINCQEIYRNGTPISSTLSLFLPLTGGTLTGVLTATTISATNISAATFSGSGASLTNLNASNISSGTLSVSRGGIGTTTLSSNQILIGNAATSILQSPNLTWNNTSNTLSATNFVGNGSQLTNLNASNITTGILSVNGSGLTSLNASNVTLGTLTVSRGGIGTTTLNNNQVLLGNGTNPINQSSNLLFDTSNNRLGICKTSPNYTLDVSGNINGNNLFLENLSNANNTLINILSETNDYKSKLVLGSGYIGSNRALSSFVDVSTCQIITKTNNLYIDSALNKTININSEGQGTINSYGNWTHNNNLSASAFIENNVSLVNKYVKKYGFTFVTATPIAIVSTPYFKYDINLNNYTTIVNFDGVIPTRKFRIMTWLKSGYHEVSPTSNLDYEIIMSNPPNNGSNGGQAGLNIQSYSYTDSKNYRLDKISSTGQFILRNSFNHLSYVSTVQDTSIACLIIDYF